MSDQKITPFFWFDSQAEEAAHFYTSIFPNSKVGDILRQGGKPLTVSFSLNGQDFVGLNGGPIFKINPSISIYVLLDTEAEVDAVWSKLVDGGMAMMALDKYPWSAKYGWLQDKYGLTWQISVRGQDGPGTMFTPAFLFSGANRNQAGDAVKFYTEIFPDSAIKTLIPYGPEGPGDEGSVMFSEFKLFGQHFIAMDNPNPAANHTFNEAVSLVVNCANQAEVDKYWDILTADGGMESQCGWLKDKFGVSWQIVPVGISELYKDPDPGRVQRAFGAMMQMKKLDLAKMRQAADNPDSKTVITIETLVDAPVGKVWKTWSTPEDIMQWNSASPDWHTPRAENDLRTGGTFSSRMEAKDGSMGFDFGGVYDEVIENQLIAYTMGDGRKVQVHFTEVDGKTHVLESFEAESMNSHEMQKAGWQSILDNFKRYAEAN